MLLIDNSIEHNMMVSQNLDENIVKIREQLEKCEDKLFEMRNGIVYRKNNDESMFYVPKDMKKNILFKYHDEFGHLGIEKTYDVFKKNYWFSNMKGKVSEHIKNCYKCIAFDPSTRKVEGFVNVIPKGDKPFHTIHIDHVCISDSRVPAKKHILVVIDGFSKFTKLYPSKSTSSKEVITNLNDYFKNYSKPHTIISDRASCSSPKEFDDFCTENDLKPIKTATGSPQAIGQVDRVNRTLRPAQELLRVCVPRVKNIETRKCVLRAPMQKVRKCVARRKFLFRPLEPMLGKLSNHYIGKKWPSVISDIEFALNNSIHKSTGQGRSMLQFGVDLRGKMRDCIKEFLDSNVNDSERNLVGIREEVKNMLKKSQDNYKLYADKKRKEAYGCTEGDYVMVRNFHSTPRLLIKIITMFQRSV